ncbi:GNAT family N-acetyltransferase [Nitrincola lacisaponensis]|uniref:GNAT family N-acetyltransferase n=1 Tax=Nitrincola lacisaponensis TaxID=267850 RepID=UPI001EF9D3C3|nr:N-acetyltransferase [Nitrincola lacisaponensis]
MQAKRDISVSVKEMQPEDLETAAEVHRLAFTRQQHSLEWLRSHLQAFPKIFCYVAYAEESCVGYIIWSQKAGFRSNAIIELEQVAVSPGFQGKGIGRALISRTLPDVTIKLQKQGSVLQHILVTTRADNHAQRLYKEVLGAEVEATLTNLYSADEVIMVARDVNTYHLSASPGS